MSLFKAALFCALVLAGSAFAEERPLLIGIQTSGTTPVEQKFISQSVRYLKSVLRHKPFMVQRMTTEEIQKLAEKGEITFAFVSPESFSVMERFFGARSLCSQQIREAAGPNSVLGTLIVVSSENSQIHSIEGLEGKRVLNPYPESFSEKMLQREFLQTKPGKHPSPLMIETGTKGLEEAVEKLSKGEEDALVIPSCLYERSLKEEYKEKIRPVWIEGNTGLVCLSSTFLYPGWTFVSFPPSTEEERALFSSALLGMPETKNGDNWRKGANYSFVQELLQTIGDKNYLRHYQWDWGVFFRQNWYWFLLPLLMIFGMILHMVRSETLVRKRTNELMTAINAKEAMEREVRLNNEKLSAMERAGMVGELSAMIAHELKQPLAVIHNYARGIKRGLSNKVIGFDEVSELIKKIDDQSKRASDIVEHVRGFAKNVPTQAVPLNFSDLLKVIIRNFEINRGMEVACDIQPGIWVEGDELELELAVSNLLKNAYDAVRDFGDREISVSLKSCSGGKLLLTVCDNGPRLSDAEFEALSVPLKTSKANGLGLGLVIVTRVVEKLGGNISFERLGERGLGILITLPQMPRPSQNSSLQ